MNRKKNEEFRLFREVIAQSNDPTLFVDPGGRFTEANCAAGFSIRPHSN